MNQSLDDIAELAESIGEMNYSRGRVNLEKIVKKNGIALIKEDYERFFMGHLVHSSGNFYIHLNTNDFFKEKIRFTLAHELGHYFIDSHRSRLICGKSLSADCLEKDLHKQVEFEANHFASNLLMPKSFFFKEISKSEAGFASILALKTKFETSIECTAHHYINNDIAPSLMIKWELDNSLRFSRYSTSFANLTGIKGKAPIKFASEELRHKIKYAGMIGIDYHEQATQLSKWISSIVPGGKKDYTGLEQTLKLGDYGAITLLTFLQ